MLWWLMTSLAWGDCTVRTASTDRTTWSAMVTNGWSLVEKGGVRTEATLEDDRVVELVGTRRRTIGWVQDGETVKLAGGIFLPWRAGPFGGDTVQVRQGLGLATYVVDGCTVPEAMVGVSHLSMRVRRGGASSW